MCQRNRSKTNIAYSLYSLFSIGYTAKGLPNDTEPQRLDRVEFSVIYLTDEKSSGSHDGNQDQGRTIYDAIRIVQNENGLFIKLNDATFTRTDANRNRVANP